MTELEKLEQELLSRMVDEPEMFAETEDICTIDPKTRTITIPASRRLIGTESDESVERLYFRCPKIVGDNIDLSTLSLRINYQNAGREKDRYIVTDMKVDGESITFSWQIRRKVAKYKGNVSFIICAVKTSDGIIKNEWNTTLNTECEVLEGLEVDQTGIEEETKDVVEQLLELLHASTEEAVGKVTAEGAAQVASVQAEGEKQLDSVREAVQEVVDDREQIQKNKADIAELYQIKAPAIICEAHGENIVVEDSSDCSLKGLTLYGKSRQLTTTGAQLLNPELFEDNKYQNNDINAQNFGISENTQHWMTGKIPVKPNTNYIISRCGGGAFYSDINTPIINKNITYGSDVKFTTPENCNYVCINMSKSTIPLGSEVMMNEGSVIKPYEPYTGGKPSPNPGYPQEIENVGDDGDVSTILTGVNIMKPCRFYYEKNWKYLYSGKKIKELIHGFMRPEEKLTVVLPKEITGLLSGVTIQDGTVDNTNSSTAYFSGKNFAVIRINKKLKDTSGNVLYLHPKSKELTEEEIRKIEEMKVMILPGDWTGKELPEYEEYRYQSLTIQIPNGLPGIPISSGGNYIDKTGQQWVCDEIDLERGKYVQKVGRVTFNGDISENWNESLITSDEYLSFYISNSSELQNIKPNSKKLCNIFQTGQADDWGLGTKKEFIQNPYGEGREKLGVRILRSRLSSDTVDAFKEFLRTNNMVIIFELNKPIENDLPPEVIEQFKTLHTNHPNTVVANDSGADMRLEYVADTKSYIDGKFKQLQETIVNTQTQMLKGV